MESHFLDRFLLHISNKEQPKMSDLKLIAEAIIDMHDYDVSFKKAFSLMDNRGRKSAKKHPSTVFKSISDGFLGNPLYLNSFLSKVNQGLQPKTEDLEQIASALFKIRDDNISFKKAFGLLKQPGSAAFDDITRLSLTEICKSENWIIYHAYEKNRRIDKRTNKPANTHKESLALIGSELYKRKHSVGMDVARQIWRIAKNVKDSDFIKSVMSTKQREQRELWFLYFSSKRNYQKKELNVSEWNDYLNLHELYREVVLRKKYAFITRGKQDYPKRLTKKIDCNLKSVFDLVESGLRSSFHITHFQNTLLLVGHLNP